MKLDKVSINETLEKTEKLLLEEKGISLALKTTLTLMLSIFKILLGRLNLNSANSSKPPASDPNRKRGSKRKKSSKKPGGQYGHNGSRLGKVGTPDKIEDIKIDRRTLPRGDYTEAGYEARQVIDFEIKRVVTEYRAQVLEDNNGYRYVAPFPDFVKTEVQYGYRVKAHAVYLSQFQLLPYARIQDYFSEQMQIQLSAGSVYNFNNDAYEALESFEKVAKQQLVVAPLLNADETGIRVNKETLWLHSLSSPKWSYFYPHEKRGQEAMKEMGILPLFVGILCHDHWKPYYTFSACIHSLCNAHHVRELEYAADEDKQKWAGKLQRLLLEINDEVNKTKTGKLSPKKRAKYTKKYRQILFDGEKECPLPDTSNLPPKRGRVKKSKSRNLLERLKEFEGDVLLFMSEPIVPFTNNRAENDLRMTKVQQKISGCFRSIEGAKIFCRIRGYLLTCQKNDVSMTGALELLFQGKLPKFVYDAEIAE